MHLKRLYQTVNKVRCHWINRTCPVFNLFDIHYMVPYRESKNNVLSCIIARIRIWLCLQSARYKFCNLTSFIWLSRKTKNINISLKFMLTDNNQIFRNCFVIIYCYLTKVSSQINKCIIFEPNELL